MDTKLKMSSPLEVIRSSPARQRIDGFYLLWILTALVAVWVAWNVRSQPPMARSKATPARTAGKTRAGSVVRNARDLQCRPGPWGDLMGTRITIERPDEFVCITAHTNFSSRWFFQNYSPSRLAELFDSCELDQAQRANLMASNHWQMGADGIVVQPPRELIYAMGNQARQRIYSVLAECTQNYLQRFAFCFRTNGFEEWFYQSGLSPRTVAMVRRLLYVRGPALCFADLPEVFCRVESPDEQFRLLKTLSRESTILLELCVKPDTDTGKLANYWGKEGMAKDIRPLLESLTRIPEGYTLDVSHLLPPFARMRLYAYPYPSEDPLALRRDCFWTVMNFFNELPDDRFCDYQYVTQVLQKEYYPVQDDLTYGDVILLLNDHRAPVHAAVYLADDIVYTKNGAHFDQPWILMEMRDLLAFYPSPSPVQFTAHRLKKG